MGSFPLVVDVEMVYEGGRVMKGKVIYSNAPKSDAGKPGKILSLRFGKA